MCIFQKTFLINIFVQKIDFHYDNLILLTKSNSVQLIPVEESIFWICYEVVFTVGQRIKEFVIWT